MALTFQRLGIVPPCVQPPSVQPELSLGSHGPRVDSRWTSCCSLTVCSHPSVSLPVMCRARLAAMAEVGRLGVQPGGGLFIPSLSSQYISKLALIWLIQEIKAQM